SHERRLDIDLRKLGLPIIPEILVAEAPGDLEIAIEPRDHEELLVDLRGLRQRVELPRMDARRHEVVARPFGGRLREDRRFDLEKAELGQRAPRALEQAMTQDQICLQLRAPQVEMAVLEPQLLGRELLAFRTRDLTRCR